MYLYHYGIRELPFSLTPNTHFYLGLPSHYEAMQVLMTALKTGEGFIKVTGEVGTGKTLLCRKLLNDMPSVFEVAYLPNPSLSPDEMRFALAAELGIKNLSKVNQPQLTQKIQLKLLDWQKKGKTVVLIIDEAQTIPWESFEALRLFTNLETESRKLIQVVLFGQPELDEMLASDRLRQLRQRITFSYKLRPLTQDETITYVQHRMRMSGHQGADVFDNKACRYLYKQTQGVPRLINVLCHKALMLSYGAGRHSVNAEQIRIASEDTDSISNHRKKIKPLLLALVILTGLLISLIAAYAFFETNTLLDFISENVTIQKTSPIGTQP